MKLLSLAILFIMIITNSAYSACSKGQIEKAVEKGCSILKAKGEAGFKEIEKITFCGDDKSYVWVHKVDFTKKIGEYIPKMLVHRAVPALIKHKNLNLIKGPGGKPLFHVLDSAPKSAAGKGWVEYLWRKAGEAKPSLKESYITTCVKEKGLVVGAGKWK